MKTNIVSIGSSQGVRLSKHVLKKCGLDKRVDLRVSDGKVIITQPGRRPREGWEEAFKEAKAKANGQEDELFIPAHE